MKPVGNYDESIYFRVCSKIEDFCLIYDLRQLNFPAPDQTQKSIKSKSHYSFHSFSFSLANFRNKKTVRKHSHLNNYNLKLN